MTEHTRTLHGLAQLDGLDLTLDTVADTEALGERIGAVVAAGDVVLLTGPLGAGKTAVARGIGRRLGVVGPITSPTFVIAREHPPAPGGRGVPMVHADAYRLGGRAELDDLDLDTDLTSAVLVVEWGEGLAERLAPAHLRVELRRLGGAQTAPDIAHDAAEPREARLTWKTET